MITAQPFDPWAALQQHAARLDPARVGALASFVGTMRDFNEDENVTGMWLEHYPGMTERYIERLLEQAKQQWAILDALIIHRVGDLQPGDNIVLVAVWAAHRAPAFDACRYLLEELKHRAPFWKRETLRDGSHRWVARNTPGFAQS